MNLKFNLVNLQARSTLLEHRQGYRLSDSCLTVSLQPTPQTARIQDNAFQSLNDLPFALTSPCHSELSYINDVTAQYTKN